MLYCTECVRDARERLEELPTVKITKQVGFVLVIAAACVFSGCIPINPANDPSLSERTILTSEDYRYYVVTKYNGVPAYEGTAEIVDYVGTSEDLVIPSEIDGIRVTSVSGIKNKVLKSVVFPESVELIRFAFGDCQLTSFSIAESGKPLNIYSSFNTNKLSNITIPARTVNLEQSFAENPIVSVTFTGSKVESFVGEAPNKNTYWLFYSYMLGKKPGTYEQREDGIFFNQQPATVPALLFQDTGVFLEAIDGKAQSTVGRGVKVWIVRPGSHVLTLRYGMSTVAADKVSNVASTGNTQFPATFVGGKQYRLKAVTNDGGVGGTVRYYAEEFQW